jgi:hypothetical protein
MVRTLGGKPIKRQKWPVPYFMAISSHFSRCHPHAFVFGNCLT